MIFWVFLFASFNAASEVNMDSGNYLLQTYIEEKKAILKTVEPNYYFVGFYEGYVVGVMESVSGIVFCPPPNATQGQIFMIVGNFLEAHPERLHEYKNKHVIDALRNAYPCKK
jgi:hypothetical protein